MRVCEKWSFFTIGLFYNKKLFLGYMIEEDKKIIVYYCDICNDMYTIQLQENK